MSLQMKPANTIKAALGIQPNGPVHKFFTQTCAIHMDKYVPMRTGALAETAVIRGIPTENVGTNYIDYVQPYAEYVYYGVSKSGKPLNYRKNKHRYAGKYWDQRMWSAEKYKVVEEVQNYMKKYGGG